MHSYKEFCLDGIAGLWEEQKQQKVNATGYPYGRKWNWTSLLNIIQKDQLEVKD